MRLVATVLDSVTLEIPRWDSQTPSRLGPQHLSAGRRWSSGKAAAEASVGRLSRL